MLIAALSGAWLVVHGGALAYGACPVDGAIDTHLAAGRVVFTGEVIQIGPLHVGGFVPYAVFAVSEDFTKRLPVLVAPGSIGAVAAPAAAERGVNGCICDRLQ